MSKTRTNSQKLYDVIKKPLVTDKSHQAMENHNQYTFEVAKDATKTEIKQAIESAFNVEVSEVRTLNTKSKAKRVGRYTGTTKTYKKAIVVLKDGNAIEI